MARLCSHLVSLIRLIVCSIGALVEAWRQLRATLHEGTKSVTENESRIKRTLEEKQKESKKTKKTVRKECAGSSHRSFEVK